VHVTNESHQKVMENMRSTPKSSILETSNKCAVILVFFIQVFRLFCVLLTFFFVFASLVIYVSSAEKFWSKIVMH